jgi:hypothetical protein
MALEISTEHRHRFDEIKKRLSIIGNRESSFTQVELLFYEALSISRNYGDDVNKNGLLADLKRIQTDQYQKTKELTRKSRREINIRHFITKLKTVLSGKQLITE